MTCLMTVMQIWQTHAMDGRPRSNEEEKAERERHKSSPSITRYIFKRIVRLESRLEIVLLFHVQFQSTRGKNVLTQAQRREFRSDSNSNRTNYTSKNGTIH